jgi:flagellar biosynthesis/type III secretory pathway protein FliH
MDMTIIIQLAKEFEEGSRDPQAILAFACMEAYQQGFDEGVEQAENQMAQTHMLLMCTAGNA